MQDPSSHGGDETQSGDPSPLTSGEFQPAIPFDPAPAPPPTNLAPLELYLAKNDQTYGPYDLDHVNHYLDAGAFQKTDLACPVGSENWTPLGQFLDLLSAPSSAPTTPSSNPPTPTIQVVSYRIRCPACDALLEIDSHSTGTQSCPACGQHIQLVVPDRPTAAPSEPAVPYSQEPADPTPKPPPKKSINLLNHVPAASGVALFLSGILAAIACLSSTTNFQVRVLAFPMVTAAVFFVLCLVSLMDAVFLRVAMQWIEKREVSWSRAFSTMLLALATANALPAITSPILGMNHKPDEFQTPELLFWLAAFPLINILLVIPLFIKSSVQISFPRACRISLATLLLAILTGAIAGPLGFLLYKSYLWIGLV